MLPEFRPFVSGEARIFAEISALDGGQREPGTRHHGRLQ